ncbi:MAG: DUF2281 domain-containing protein [Cyanobacteria bacterium RU_5_0]|nr:DUF2281 domain-containing protein [Cyanobacteria bacterium RU_5_0]
MNVEQLVTEKLRLLPPEKQREVLDFVEFLERKFLDARQDKLALSRLSESALQKDWLQPEEAAAWQDL